MCGPMSLTSIRIFLYNIMALSPRFPEYTTVKHNLTKLVWLGKIIIWKLMALRAYCFSRIPHKNLWYCWMFLILIWGCCPWHLEINAHLKSYKYAFEFSKFRPLGVYKCLLAMRILEFHVEDNIRRICKFPIYEFSKFW